MPTYQYRCTECGEPLEVVQKFTDPTLTECPRCAGRLRKVFSPVGVVFKGSGFYKTDSRAAEKSRSSAGGKDKDGAAAKDGSGSGDGGSKDGAGNKDGAGSSKDGSSSSSSKESAGGGSKDAGSTAASTPKSDGAASGSGRSGGDAKGATHKVA